MREEIKKQDSSAVLFFDIKFENLYFPQYL